MNFCKLSQAKLETKDGFSHDYVVSERIEIINLDKVISIQPDISIRNKFTIYFSNDFEVYGVYFDTTGELRAYLKHQL